MTLAATAVPARVSPRAWIAALSFTLVAVVVALAYGPVSISPGRVALVVFDQLPFVDVAQSG